MRAIKFFFTTILSLACCTATAHTPHAVTVIGTGYVGLVLGACLSDFGHHVVCVDVDEQKIRSLKSGILTIHEPGLAELVEANVAAHRLVFTSDIATAIQSADIVFIAVGTPMSATGKADITAVEAVAKTIGENLNGYKVICVKSTVPLGMNNAIRDIIQDALFLRQAPSVAEAMAGRQDERFCKSAFDIVSNPEFLREGSAVYDSFNPDRVIVGCNSEKAKAVITELYEPFIAKNVPFLFTDLVSAEMIKYASNAFLATKISYINEIARLCDCVQANVKDVACGMGLDDRIGKKFLNPGPGWAGSCFPKDTQALLYTAHENGIDLKVVQAAVEANEFQQQVVIDKITKVLGCDVRGKRVAVLGLAFKANTDDVRESSALKIIERLVGMGAHICAYDPIAMPNAQKMVPSLNCCASVHDAVKGADVLVVLTEWPEFATLDLAQIKELAPNVAIVDTRNILNTRVLRDNGIVFENMGMKLE